MNRYDTFKGYVKRLFAKKEKFSLVKLMSRFEKMLIGYKMDSSKNLVFKLFKSSYERADRLLSSYERKKRSCIMPTQRSRLRKQTAKEFFQIVQQIGAAIPKCLMELPHEQLPDEEFAKWKEEQKKGLKMFKDIFSDIKTFADLDNLKKGLDELANDINLFLKDGKLQRFVVEKIKQESINDFNDIQIGGPTIKHGPEIR